MAEGLYIIDGTAFAYRSFFAIRQLSDSKGRPTNAVFGFARVLIKILREQNPSHIVMAFDAPGKTFRHEAFPEYKATRQETPPELIAQLPLIDKVVEAFNIPVLRVAGVEADDVMGTLAVRAVEAGMKAVIVTGDKDALQLVSDAVRVFDPSKGDEGVWYGPQEVKERFGAGPEHVVDALGLMGDTADNIPGVKGIGPKTAYTLLEKYGSLEGVYEHIGELKGKQRENIEAGRESAFMSRDLSRIRTDVDVDIALDACRRQAIDRDKLTTVLTGLEFHSLLREFFPDGAQAAAPAESAASAGTEQLDYRLVLTEPELAAAIAEMRKAGCFAVDTETTSTDPMRADLVGVSMSARAATGYYIPVGHQPEAMAAAADDEPQAGARLTLETALAMLRPLLEDAAVGKVGHNIKYDLIVFERAGIRLAGITLDTMVASYLTDPSRFRHNLDEVSLYYLKRKTIPISELIGKGTKAITFDHVPIDRACEYASEDADMTWRLAEVFRPLLHERGLETLFQDVELPLICVLARMEQAGVAIDENVFDGLQHEIEKGLHALAAEIYATAGETFQINSPKQLQDVLFGKLGLKPTRKTKTGYSTDVEVLEELANEHPLPKKILEYRTLEKLRGTYVEALPKLVHPETGRIHTSFNQTVAATGRLSSSEPNLQNIPVRTDIGRRIREGFIPRDEDYRLISADYSQVELRILAHLSGDRGLAEAFEHDFDIHRDTAARVFDVMPELVTPEMRRQAKAVNFGVVYGISPFGLARNIGLSTGEAARFIERYFAQYPGVKVWIERTLVEARERGYVTTVLNRRRYVADLNSSNVSARKAAERVAINTPVQGSAADLIKLAMVRLDKALADTRARLLIQVHDELVAEAPADDAERIGAVMKETMEKAIALDVPLKVDVGVGNNWAEIH